MDPCVALTQASRPALAVLLACVNPGNCADVVVHLSASHIYAAAAGMSTQAHVQVRGRGTLYYESDYASGIDGSIPWACAADRVCMCVPRAAHLLSVCTADTDGCANSPCSAANGMVNSNGTCYDIRAPGVGFRCACNDLYRWNGTTCTGEGRQACPTRSETSLSANTKCLLCLAVDNLSWA